MNNLLNFKQMKTISMSDVNDERLRKLIKSYTLTLQDCREHLNIKLEILPHFLRKKL